jgi:hypothetical protein
VVWCFGVLGVGAAVGALESVLRLFSGVVWLGTWMAIRRRSPNEAAAVWAKDGGTVLRAMALFGFRLVLSSAMLGFCIWGIWG